MYLILAEILHLINPTLSAEALDQINKKGYDTEMREEGVADIIKFGIAFSGKRVKIRTE